MCKIHVLYPDFAPGEKVRFIEPGPRQGTIGTVLGSTAVWDRFRVLDERQDEALVYGKNLRRVRPLPKPAKQTATPSC